jgi:type I restriction enzyme S subunit
MNESFTVQEAPASYQVMLDTPRVRSGYKQTEVGVIPEDWDVDSFASVTPSNGRNGIVDGPFGSNLKTIHYRKSGVPIVTSGFVTEGHFFADSYLYVDKEKFEDEKRSAVQAGDIVMAKIGARCGASAILPEWHQVSILSGNALKITVDQSRHSTFYIWQVLWNLYLRGRMEALRTVGAQPAISMAQLKQYKIPLPPFAEQRAIATALSDVDALLAAQDKLIAKKRDIKQAAMQQLLTGKQRLPGFNGDWEVRRLGELLEYEQPTKYLVNDSEYSHDNDVPVLTAGKTFILGYTHEEHGIFNNLPAIIFDDFTTANKYVTFPFKAKSSAMKILKPRDSTVNLRLVFEMMQLIKFQLGDHKRYWISEYQNLEMNVPSPEEQTAIATILSDMDADLTALEQQRDKTSAIKQGMMQELLTGRIRLV